MFFGEWGGLRSRTGRKGSFPNRGMGMAERKLQLPGFTEGIPQYSTLQNPALATVHTLQSSGLWDSFRKKRPCGKECHRNFTKAHDSSPQTYQVSIALSCLFRPPPHLQNSYVLQHYVCLRLLSRLVHGL